MFNVYDTYAYFEGEVVPFSDAKISVMNHAFNYGTACFGGIRGNWNEDDNQLYIFRLEDHYRRLCHSARLLMMDFERKISFDRFRSLILEIVRKSSIRSDVYIRPLLYKSSEFVGVRLHGIEDDLTIYLVPLGDYIPLDGIRCSVSSWRRISDNAISARGKITGTYVNSAFSKSEAILNGFDEAIVLDDDGYVVEGSAENIFIVRDGALITPSYNADILEGITAKTIMQFAFDEGISLERRPIGRTELYLADEIFLCGTGAKVSPVVEVDRRLIGDGKPGTLSRKLQALYFDAVKGSLKRYSHWLTPVY